jgi:hypothetical protein
MFLRRAASVVQTLRISLKWARLPRSTSSRRQQQTAALRTVRDCRSEEEPTVMTKARRAAPRAEGHEMSGREKFKRWAAQSAPIEQQSQQSKLGGRQNRGIERISDDAASQKKRYERTEAFLRRPRENFPEDDE